jgi:hypothetical protein
VPLYAPYGVPRNARKATGGIFKVPQPPVDAEDGFPVRIGQVLESDLTSHAPARGRRPRRSEPPP